MRVDRGLSIGALADRTGLAVSAIRYYESQGLVHAERNAGGQRRFARAEIRRLSFVMIAQQFGVSLAEIRALLDELPEGRPPTPEDWQRISLRFRDRLDARIDTLTPARATTSTAASAAAASACRAARSTTPTTAPPPRAPARAI